MNADGLHMVKEIDHLLESAKASMLDLSGRLAKAGSDWDAAESLMGWARYVDAVRQKVRGITSGQGGDDAELAFPPRIADTEKLPRYYRDGDKLVKRGPRRDGGHYEHRVPRADYDHIVGQLCEIAKTTREFASRALQEGCRVPRHEPGIVTNLFVQNGIVLKVSRGRYAFAKRQGLREEADRTWRELPTQ